MKYFIAIALLVAVASARMVKPVASELAELQEIIAAINSPSTDPATAAALEEMLLDVLGIKPEPVDVGPAIIDSNPISVGPAIIDSNPISVGPAIIESNPISVGPAIIDFPLPDGALAEEPVIPGPAVEAPAPVAPVAQAAPLVQIILNINQASAEASPIAVGPAVEPTPVHVVDVAPEPVHVVEVAPEPVQVVEVAPEPVQVVESIPIPVPAEPVQVVESVPLPAEPVIVGVPVLPEPVVALPEVLN